MALNIRTELLNKSVTASESGSVKAAEPLTKSHHGWVVVTDYTGLTSIDIDIETSADGINWVVSDSFTQITANTFERIIIPEQLLPKVRAEVTVVGTGSATVVCAIYSDKER